MLTTKKRLQIVLIFSVGIGLAAGLTGCAPSGARALAKGEKLLHDGKYPEAVLKFQEATRAFPNHAKAWNQLGLGYQYAGESKKALQAYQKALTLDRNLTAASYNLGTLYSEHRNFPEAIAQFTTFVQLEQNNPDGWFKLGVAQSQYANLVVGAEKGRQLDAAKRNLEWSQKLRPSPETLNAIGLVQIQRGRPREAVSCFNSVLKQQPDYSPALLNLAVVYHQYLNEGPAALMNYRQFLKVGKDAPETAKVQMAIRQLETELNPPVPVPVPVPAPASASASASTPVVAPPTPKPAPVVVQVSPATVSRPLPPASAPPPQSSPPPSTSPPPPAKVGNGSVVAKIIEAAPPKVLTAPKPAPIQTVPREQPAARKETPVETVKVPEAVPIKAVENIPVPAPTKPVAVVASNVELAAAPTRVSTRKETNPGVLTKLNPTTWFKKKTGATTRVTTLPAAQVNAERFGTASVPEIEPVLKVQAKAANPGPPGPRYHYRSPSRPLEGTRAEAEPVFKSAVQAHRNRLMGEALELYRQAMRLDPSYFEACYNFALVTRESKDFEASLGAYEQALAIQPESVNARYNFAFTLQEAGYFEDAANELKELLGRNPNETRAHLLLGTLFAQRLNRSSAAREHYLKVLETEPHHPQSTQLRYWVAANP